MEHVPGQEVKERYLQVLADVGAEAKLCQFYADVMQCEYEMTHATYRMHKELIGEFEKESFEYASLFAVTQGMCKRFYHWKCCIGALSEQGVNLPPLQLSADKVTQSNALKALCSLETNQMNLHEGDDLVITDVTCPDQFKVRTPGGHEGYVPALCCILPTPDYNAVNAVERLQVHLLASWSDSEQRLKSLLFKNIEAMCQLIYNTWNNSYQLRAILTKDRDRVRRRFQRVFDSAIVRPQGLDLSRLHSTLFSLEKELATLNFRDLTPLIQDVANLDKAVLCCQNFHRQYLLFRDSLKDAARPIQIVKRLEHFRELAEGKRFRYYELKMTLDDVEVTEETTYTPGATQKTPLTPLTPVGRRTPLRSTSSTDSTPSGRRVRMASSSSGHEMASEETGTVPVLPGGISAKHEAVNSEQLTTEEGVERQRIVIKAVKDSRPESQWKSSSEHGLGLLTMEEAVKAKVLVPSRGIYRNVVTGEEQPIAAAMSNGLIQVDYVTTRRSVEKTKAVGLVTIRTMIDRREFTVTEVIDSLTAERIDAEQARQREILVVSESIDGGGYYVNETNGERIPLTTAIDAGWVFATYDEQSEGATPDEEIHTYAITDVFDPLLNTEVSFADAVRRGIINTETGDYVDRRISARHESIPLADAIGRGLVRARLVDDADAEFGLKGSRAADRKDTVVVQRFDKIRRNVLKGLRVINAFKSVATSDEKRTDEGLAEANGSTETNGAA